MLPEQLLLLPMIVFQRYEMTPFQELPSIESLHFKQTTLDTMILGVPMKLQSQFRLTYNMILNLLRVEALRVEEMIKRSFSENASQKLLPEHQKKVIQVSRSASVLESCSISHRARKTCCHVPNYRVTFVQQTLVDITTR